jgi:uncharacterized protein (TIGR03437 family)
MTLTGVSVVAGSDQETAPGSSFAPITIQVSAAEGPPVGFAVQLTSNGAPLSFSNGGLALTDSSGRATVSAQAGSTSGTAIVTATAGKFSISFNLTVRAAQPAITSELSFANAASGQPGGISPAEMVTVYAARLAPDLQGCATTQARGPLPLSLSGVKIQFATGSYSAFGPLYSVCNINGLEYAVVQAPADLPFGYVTVTAQVGSLAIGQSTIASVPATPGIFETAMSDGARRAMLQRADGSFVSVENPAKRGERLRAFVTGLGRPVTASGVSISTNQAGIVGDDAAPPNPVKVSLAGRDVQLVSDIYATDMIGVYVLSFDVPGDAPSGSDINFTVSTLLDGRYEFAKSTKAPIQ